MTDAVDRIVEQWARELPELPTEAMSLFGRIYRVSAAAGDIMERVYAGFGITRSDFDVLATLRRSGPPYQLSPGALTSTLMLSTAGMTGRLNRLQVAGLVLRSPDTTDRRSVLVRLSETGLAVIEEAVVAGVAVQQQLLNSLEGPRRAELDQLLRELLGACVDYREKANLGDSHDPSR